MVRFLVGILLALLAGAGYAVSFGYLPAPEIGAAAALVFAVIIYVAAMIGAPRLPLISHIYGLALGAVGVWASWVAWTGLQGGRALGDPLAIDVDAAMAAAQQNPDAWMAQLQTLSSQLSFDVQGFALAGETLLIVWAVEAGVVLLAGLMGGHAGRSASD